ncbi:MAG: hypothetical protein ACREQX_11990 [Candidatus Binataceae bacterium]
MITPSFFASLVGIALIAMLAAADWYVWGLTYATGFNKRPHVKPLTGAQMLEHALQNLERVNWAVLPYSALQPMSKPEPAHEGDGGDYKKVA